MSDARLRELERTWRATGAEADHAALLQERVRKGLLADVRLQLAAELGHTAARIACPIPEVQVAPRRRVAREMPWCESLYGYGRTLGGTDGRVFSGAQWPGSTEIARLRHALRHTRERVGVEVGHEATIRAGLAVALDASLGLMAAHVRTTEEAVLADRMLEGVSSLLPLTVEDFHRCPRGSPVLRWQFIILRAEERLGADVVHARVSAELIPWALGERDPLRERVEARRASAPPP